VYGADDGRGPQAAGIGVFSLFFHLQKERSLFLTRVSLFLSLLIIKTRLQPEVMHRARSTSRPNRKSCALRGLLSARTATTATIRRRRSLLWGSESPSSNRSPGLLSLTKKKKETMKKGVVVFMCEGSWSRRRRLRGCGRTKMRKRTRTRKRKRGQSKKINSSYVFGSFCSVLFLVYSVLFLVQLPGGGPRTIAEAPPPIQQGETTRASGPR